MVYLLPRLPYPAPKRDEFTNGQTIVIAVMAYIGIALFAMMFIFTLHNIWKYLIK